MFGLILDTSTNRSVLAFLKDGKVLLDMPLPVGNQSSLHLLPAIEKGLKTLGLEPSSFAYIGVGIGPASYTGIRIGAAVAKSLAFALKIPLIGIGTLESFVPEQDGAFAVIIDAKVSGAYLLMGEKRGELIHYVSEPEVVSLVDLPDKLEKIAILVTPEMSRLSEKLPQERWNWIECAPSLARMSQLVHQKYLDGMYRDDTSLDLNYLRKTQAEIEREVKKCGD